MAVSRFVKILKARKQGKFPVAENKFLETRFLSGESPETWQESVYLDEQMWTNHKEEKVYVALGKEVVWEVLKYCRAIEWRYEEDDEWEERFNFLRLSHFCRDLIRNALIFHSSGVGSDELYVSIGFTLKKVLSTFRCRLINTCDEYKEPYATNQKEE